MASALFPDVVNFNDCHDMAHQILDDLVYRGNRVAQARRSELCHLEDLCSELISRGQQRGLQTLHLLVPDLQGIGPDGNVHREHQGLASTDNEAQPLSRRVDASHSLHTGFPMTSDTEFLDDFGISSEDFLSIVQQIGDSETFPDSMLTLS
jgi:proline utilization trans-activator